MHSVNLVPEMPNRSPSTISLCLLLFQVYCIPSMVDALSQMITSVTLLRKQDPNTIVRTLRPTPAPTSLLTSQCWTQSTATWTTRPMRAWIYSHLARQRRWVLCGWDSCTPLNCLVDINHVFGLITPEQQYTIWSSISQLRRWTLLYLLNCHCCPLQDAYRASSKRNPTVGAVAPKSPPPSPPPPPPPSPPPPPVHKKKTRRPVSKPRKSVSGRRN